MEFIEDTTIQELPEKIKSLNISPETHIRVIIEKIREKDTIKISDEWKTSKLLFLNNDLWDGEGTPTDLAENHDHYLYDEE